MARLFDDASSQYLQIETPIISAWPMTMACWGNSNDATVNQTAMAACASGSALGNNIIRLMFAGAAAGDPVRFSVDTGGTTNNLDTTTGFTADTPAHACCVSAGNTDRRVYINGGSKATTANSKVVPTGLDRFLIGGLRQITNGFFFSGTLWEAAIWDAALGDDEVLELSKGVSPLLVRPQNILAYWPIIGRHSPEIDIVGANGLAVTGATAAAHPRIFYPVRPTVHPKAAAAPGGTALLLRLQEEGLFVGSGV